MFAALGLWRFAIYAVLIAAFVGYVAYEKSAYDNRRRAEGAQPFKDAIESQIREAKLVLASETAKSQAITAKWIEYSRSSDDEYEKKIASIRASANVAGGLRDPGRSWQSNSCTPAGQGDTKTLERTASSGELSPELDSFLRSEASRADEVAAYALSCYQFVNKEP